MIKSASIFFVFAYGAGVALASGDVSQFVFTTNSQTIKPNETSEIITVQAQDTSGAAVSAGKTLCLRVASASGTGEFSSNSENWILTNVLTINSNWTSRSFYYKDSVAGNYLIDAQIAIKPDGTTCSSWPVNEWDIKWKTKQDIAISANFSSNISQTSSSAQNSSSVSSLANSGGGSVSWPNEQQIYANAGKDKTGIAGADVLFEGKALGIKKEPLENARYLWNFGDGASGEGQNTKHAYKYPGNYIVVLDVSSGQYSVSDKINVKIASNELVISEASDEFIKLKNKSGIILDISGWFLMGEGVLFKFPESSFIVANSELVISFDISKIKFGGKDIKADLLYSNGSVAFSYQNKKETKPQPIMPAAVAATTAVAVSSSSHTDKIAQIIQPAKKPKPTTVVGFATTTQLANVITIGEKNNSGAKIWLILAVITGIIGGAGIFLAKKFTYTAK